MQIGDLSSGVKRRKKKRVGRGGKRGVYSGRGIKGQKARAGRKIRPEFRDLIKKLPKLRGYRFAGRKEKFSVINLDTLDENYNNNDEVTPKTLVSKSILFKRKGRLPIVKILGRGEISKKLSVSGCKLSRSAFLKIEKVGGQISIEGK